MIAAAIAAVAIGAALGLRASPPVVVATETIQPKNFDRFASEQFSSQEQQVPVSRGMQLASIDSGAVFRLEDSDTSPGLATSATGRTPADDRTIAARAASFAERFMGAIDWPVARPSESTQVGTNRPLAASDQVARASAGRAVAQAARTAAPVPASAASAPANAPKKPVRVADASASDDLSLPADTDSHTAIYDILAHKVYLPSGKTLEAHSGLGSYLDDPRYVAEKDRGPTPPNVYDLALREEPFHGVRAIRLNPVGSGNMFGRDGMLAHTYMLGANGQSNGCVSFSDYPAFLNAVLSGEVNRLVVVEHLPNAPGSRTASGWIPEAIKSFFGRS
jgi:Protein of unknown function (DUF2778)